MYFHVNCSNFSKGKERWIERSEKGHVLEIVKWSLRTKKSCIWHLLGDLMLSFQENSLMINYPIQSLFCSKTSSDTMLKHSDHNTTDIYEKTSCTCDKNIIGHKIIRNKRKLNILYILLHFCSWKFLRSIKYIGYIRTN